MDSSRIIFVEEDIPYEEEILRNAFSVKCWLRYIEHKKMAPYDQLNLIYERGLKELPGSYKLWYNYLRLRKSQLKGKPISDPLYEETNNAFERSLACMNKMPRIWLDYCSFLVSQGFITRSRRTFDRALRALPVTQHHRIWKPYLEFVRKNQDLQETAVRVHRRFLMLMPEDTEEFIEYLISAKRLDEAALLLVKIINDDRFYSKEGKTKHQLWNELCDIASKHPDDVQSLKIEPIIRQGIKKYTDQVGVLWNSLADYYIRSQQFEKARDIYEEGIQTVVTVRDFSQIFDTYSQFEEQLVTTKMQSIGPEGATEEDDLELELLLARLEDLMDRRSLLLNSVLLRQNPHNVHEWHKRVKLFEDKPREVINTYTEAVQTVDPKLATGKMYTLFAGFAKFYEQARQIEDARIIFEKGTLVAYKHVDELASIWCEFIEMELRHENYEEARKLLQTAVTPKKAADYHDDTETVQNRLYKSLKVWALYADLEETFGTYKSCKAVYDRILELRIASPQIVMNYAMFLEELNYYEEAFKAYERGIALFRWPNVYEIWTTYLTKFVERYGGKKLERARDLFEQCLEKCPPQFAKGLYLLYAKLEEDHGLAQHAMSIYDRATMAVLAEEQHEMFNIYIKRAAELFGVTHTRPIYHKAIELLNDTNAREMSMRFADLECKLGEIDRARSIYAHCSQICDPRVATEFWKTWKEFEIKHGNEDTLRELLRVRRSVMAVFNTQVNFMSAQMLNTKAAKRVIDEETTEEGDSMEQLEKRARKMADAEAEDQPAVNKSVQFIRSTATEEDLGDIVTRTNNPDEINIDDEDEEESDMINEIQLEKRAIPNQVFGKLIPENQE